MGQPIVFCPYTIRKLSVYQPEHTELAPSDRVRITRNDAALDVANGDRATVRAISARKVTLELDNNRRVLELPADVPLHLDLAYATTVHVSQGTTAERVLSRATGAAQGDIGEAPALPFWCAGRPSSSRGPLSCAKS